MWTVRMTDAQRDALLALMHSQGALGLSLAAALEELEYARWDDLPEAELPWERVSELADAQGIDEADVVWDLAGGLKPSITSSAAIRHARARARREAAQARRRAA